MSRSSFSVTAGKSPHLRVLVVDDEFLIRWSIGEALSHAGHTVWEADNGAKALVELAGAPHAFDAVVLDHHLPDCNDLTLLARIRQLTPASKVILITAFGTSEVARRARELGAYDVINKPFDLNDLEALLGKACDSRAG